MFVELHYLHYLHYLFLFTLFISTKIFTLGSVVASCAVELAISCIHLSERRHYSKDYSIVWNHSLKLFYTAQ